VRGERETNAENEEHLTGELTRRFRWVEITQIGSSIVLAVVGVIALYIYSGQLTEMRKSTKAAQDAADAAKESVDLARKQMEDISAAVIEITKGVSVSFPVAPFGETRINLRNSGHIIAHDVHVSISLSVKDKDRHLRPRRVVFSKTETIPAIAPSMLEDRPDRIYSFELSQAEYRRLMTAMDCAYIEGSIDYENGFGTRTKQPFCYAQIWGEKFGSWAGACDQVQTQINLARDREQQKVALFSSSETGNSNRVLN